MKKYMLVSLVLAFLLVTVGSSCFGATVANTSKKGSLLIFPLIRTDAATTSWETLITIGNDYPIGVKLQCIFVLKDSCSDPLGFDFDLTASQPVTFKASDGKNLEGEDVMGAGIGVGEIAEAKCWVKNFVLDEGDAGTYYQMSYNHLSGEATLLESYLGSGVGAATYNAWRFAANAPLGSAVSTPGTLVLDGLTNNYDTCPASLLYDFLRQTDTPESDVYNVSVDNFIALVPCKQDLRQVGGPTVLKTRIVRYDENERSGSGQICVNCFFADSASNANAFPNVNTPAGVFRAEPFAEVGGPCSLPSPEIDTYPVVGVIVKRFNGRLTGPIVASTPTGSGMWEASPGAPNYRGTPQINWDVY